MKNFLSKAHDTIDSLILKLGYLSSHANMPTFCEGLKDVCVVTATVVDGGFSARYFTYLVWADKNGEVKQRRIGDGKEAVTIQRVYKEYDSIMIQGEMRMSGKFLADISISPMELP